jgi:hypothetical protein
VWGNVFTASSDVTLGASEGFPSLLSLAAGWCWLVVVQQALGEHDLNHFRHGLYASPVTL